MANQFATRQWFIDTPFSTPAQLPQSGAPLKIQQFEFMGYGVVTDEVIVEDRNGNVIWEGHGEAALNTVRSGKVGNVNGLTVPTLTAGQLIVYIE